MVNPVQDSKLFFTPVSGFVSASGLGFGDTVGFGDVIGVGDGDGEGAADGEGSGFGLYVFTKETRTVCFFTISPDALLDVI